jgi:toxin-antitoxin system PIN domain toxin
VKLFDVNVVIAAGRPDHEHHDLVRGWFDTVMDGHESFTVPDVVWSAFARVVTNGRIFAQPSSPSDAFEFLRLLQDHPLYTTVVPGSAHLAHFERLCLEADIRGRRVPDAYLAAIAIEHACTLVSLDRDFGRFDGLDWERPV